MRVTRRRSRRRPVVFGLLVGIVLAAAACDREAEGSKTTPQGDSKYAANVLHVDGIGNVRFGAERKDLTDRKLIAAGGTGCNDQEVYDVPGYVDAADLIFGEDDKLNFIWVLSPAVHTPEKVTVESPIAAVRKAYPQAEELAANDRSFAGLLVKSEKTGFLFLFEPASGQVVKLIAGFTDTLRAAQTEGIPC